MKQQPPMGVTLIGILGVIAGLIFFFGGIGLIVAIPSLREYLLPFCRFTRIYVITIQ